LILGGTFRIRLGEYIDAKASNEIEKYLLADKILLGYTKILLSQDDCFNGVFLHSYRADIVKDGIPDENYQNLGDYLSHIVVSYMLNKSVINITRKGLTHLYAVGSILSMGYQNAVVWGSGFAYEPSILRSMPHRFPFRKLDVRCVRGPKTRKTLMRLGHKCPENYGDPVVLMPLIYNPEHIKKKRKVLMIPHYQAESCGKWNMNYDKISMKTADYKGVIDEILSSEMVISSSLHGIILAESYGVPAVFYRDRSLRFDYKYEDWYLSTGRKLAPVTDIEKAIKNRQYMEIPNLWKMRKTLKESFPADMFDSDIF